MGIAYKLEHDEDIITSGALLHLTVKDTNEILPDYLTLVHSLSCIAPTASVQSIPPSLLSTTA